MPKSSGGAAQSTEAGSDGDAAGGLSFSALFKAQVKAGQGVDKEGALDAETVTDVVANAVARQDVELLSDAGLAVGDSLMSPAGKRRITQAEDARELVLSGGLIRQVEGQQITQAEDTRELSLNGGHFSHADERQIARAEDARESALNDGLNPLVGGGVLAPLAVTQQAKLPVQNATISGEALVGVESDPDVLAQLDLKPSKVRAIYLGSDRRAEIAADGKMLPQNRLEKNGEGLILPVLPVESQRIPENPVNALPVMMATHPSSVVEAKNILPPAATLHAPVGASGWGDALGQRVVWMAGQQTQVAELRLNPAHLGPMEVRLSVNNDQITAIFVSHQPAVREAIEAAMPRLREMLADSGLSLGSATVSSDSLPQQQSSGREGSSGSSRSSDFSGIGNMHSSLIAGGGVSLRAGSGMVDLFA
ncbi:MAG: flagellar hook-length control protein FliK [Sulfurimicrobium sp.]|nr:flagellar hook-length control protein FliK [Sulfurimicrobium sp.]